MEWHPIKERSKRHPRDYGEGNSQEEGGEAGLEGNHWAGRTEGGLQKQLEWIDDQIHLTI